MRLLFTLILASCIYGQAFGSHLGISAIRGVQESYEEARGRHFLSKKFRFPDDVRTPPRGIRYITAEQAKRPLAVLDFSEVPDVGTYSELERLFFFVRDTRFISSEQSDFLRRPTWLYPDDGCYARAEVAKNQLRSQNAPLPKKIYVFGDLVAESSNTSSGSVRWWYHVAISYRVGTSVYVLDPAIEPKRPLKLLEWNKKVGGERVRVQYSICSSESYDATADCNGSDALTVEDSLGEQRSFFNDEWRRLLDLHRQPEVELGDHPPWL